MISIIIPTFNRSKSLVKAINSVFNQTHHLWELIIVDDGSVDDTYKAISSYLDHPKFQYIFQQNKGVSSARNLGALKAKGEFLIFLDSDDFIFPELIGEIQKLNLNSLILFHGKFLKHGMVI